jgi:Dolichyl-phosphate-mannose-protein mannosyltransferase
VTRNSTHASPLPVRAADARASVFARVESAASSRELLWLVVLLGVVPRIWLYATNPSLWLDESFLALNVMRRGLPSLIGDPLDFNQTAPPGFLFVEKVATDVFGKGEYALRGVPILCGIASVPLFALLARRVLPPAACVVATALVAVTGPLVYYSSELKPYAGDVAATLAIALMGIALLENRVGVQRVLAFGLLGFVLIEITYAGIFAAAGTAALLIVITVLDRARDRALPLLAVTGFWALGAIVFLLLHKGVERGQFMHGKYGRFAPFPTTPGAVAWYFDRARDLAYDANLYHPPRSPLVVATLLAAGLALVGAAHLLLRRWRLFAVLVAPVVVTLLASLAHQYPLLARTMLFFVPLLFIFVASGLVLVVRVLPAPAGAAAATIAAAVLVTHVAFAGPRNSFVPSSFRPEIKESLGYVARHWRRGDVLYIQYASQYAFGYYSECDCFRLPGNRKLSVLWPVRPATVRKRWAQFPRALISESPNVVIGTRRPVHTERPSHVYQRDASRLARYRRAWVVVTWYLGPEELHLIKHELFGDLARRGRLVTARHRERVYLYLYAFPR